MASKTISGIFGGRGTPAVNSWDAMHTFSTRSADHFGGKMHAGAGYAGGKVSKALQEFYKTEKLNPCITSIKITVDPKEWTTAWEVTIDESPDGKAYVGLNSWGGATGGYPAKKPPGDWAYSNYVKEKKAVTTNYPGALLKDVIDFYFPGGFRQIFFQYTISNKFPDLPKSANAKNGTVGVKIGASGSPTNLPEYNGMVMPAVTIEPAPVVIEQDKTENLQDIPKKKDPDPVVVVIPGPPNPLLVTGKISLKVKSGPGVIIGITDVDIIDGRADFSGIQFDQPGDYVVTIGCTSPDVEPSEMKFKVLPQEDVIAQEEKKAEPEKPTGKRPIIAQIDKPTIPIEPMEFERGGVDLASTAQVATSIGLTPFVNYNGVVIESRNIQSFVLEHEGMLPKVSVIFTDQLAALSEEPPRDDTPFEIFLNSRSINLKYIHLNFKIIDFQKLPTGNQYSIKGILNVSGLYRNKFKVKRGTSFEALRDICKDLQLGFNSNIENTNDHMPWRNIGDKQLNFMEDIVKHSYISDESFMAGYIDFYYCFNYVDIEKEMKREITDDVGIDTGGIDIPSINDIDKISPLILYSEKGLQTSNLFFAKIGERSESTKISMEQGYRTRTKFYDKFKKMFLVFDVDSTTTDGSKNHILKGHGDDKEAFDNNYITKYQGKIDTDNVHKNHNYAVTQNKINLDNMMKNQMDIILPNPNFNLYRFQKIQVILIKSRATISSPETVEWRFSGEWMISAIKFVFMNGKLNQEITLARKEMGKNPQEIDAGTNNGTKEKKEEKSENPIVGTPAETITNKPNSKYKVGDVFTVENSDGEKFILTIAKLSDNGTDVVVTLKTPTIVPDNTITSNDTISEVVKTEEVVTTPPVIPPVVLPVGKYPYQVTFESVLGPAEYDLSQVLVSRYTFNHRAWVPANNKIETEDEQLSKFNHGELFIAIRRNLPTFKPEGAAKSEAPYNWVLFELKDLGIEKLDTFNFWVAGEKKVYEITKSRLLEGREVNFEVEVGKKYSWSVPTGYVKIKDEAGNVVIDSANSWGVVTGDGRLSFGSSASNTSVSMWSGIEEVPLDEAYPLVGGKNTLCYDMMADKYTPGVYTIEVKYYVPLYEKDSTKRILTKDSEGYNAYESKILTASFTIVKKSTKK
jgi:hypothetical protein